MKKKLAALAAVGTIGLVGLGGAGASALSSTSSSNDSHVSKLVEKFKLNESEVQAVFDEEKVSRDAKRTTHMSERLQDAVDNGDITAEQKKLIEAKSKELQATREKERAELEKWAEDNDIDERYLMGGMRMGMKGGHGGGHR